MRKVAIFLIGSSLFVLIFASISQFMRMRGQKKEPIRFVKTSSKAPKPGQGKGGKDVLEQTIVGFRVPGIDENGVKQWEIEGDKAISRGKTAFELVNPKISIASEPNKKGQGVDIVVKAAGGELDRATDKAVLKKNVVIRIGKDATIETESLRWNPKTRHVFTDSPVVLKRKGLVLTGTGLEVDVDLQRGVVLKDVRVLVEEGGSAFAFGKKVAKEPKGQKGGEEPVVITCEDRLVIDLKERKARFNGNTHIERGTSRLDCSRLDAFFDEKTHEISRVLAVGNVHVVNQNMEMFADMAEWAAKTQPPCVTLTGEKEARILQGNNQISGQKILLYPDSQSIEVPEAGRLKATVSRGPTKKGSEPIEIHWLKRMTFNGKEAVFEGGVNGREGGFGVDCDLLRVRLADDQKNIQELVATGNVRVIDGERNANGDQLVWNPGKDTAVLTGKGGVTVVQGDIQMTTRKIVMDRRKQLIVGSGPGRLHAEKTPKDKKGPAETVVTWLGDMSVFTDQHKAVFEEEVDASRGDMKLHCQKLTVLFDQDNKQIRGLHAVDEVHVRTQGVTATGDELNWEIPSSSVGTDGGLVTITAKPPCMAEVKSPSVSLEAPKIVMDREEDVIRAIGAGRLKAAGKKGMEQSPADRVVVTWERDMVFPQKEHKAVFRKNVEATRGLTDIHCDRMVVSFDEANKEVLGLDATGNVKVSDADKRGRGDHLVYDRVTSVFKLEGTPRAEMGQTGYAITSPLIVTNEAGTSAYARGPGTLTIETTDTPKVRVDWADRMTFDKKAGIASFYKDVIVTREKMKLRADKIDVWLTKEDKIERVTGQGDVLVTAPDKEISGQRFEWDMEKDIAEIIGEPDVMIWQKGNTVVARKAYFSQKNQFVRCEGASAVTLRTAGSKPSGKKKQDKSEK